MGASGGDYVILRVCGIFSYEVAETKVSQVIDYARENQHPLQCTLEQA